MCSQFKCFSPAPLKQETLLNFGGNVGLQHTNQHVAFRTLPTNVIQFNSRVCLLGWQQEPQQQIAYLNLAEVKTRNICIATMRKS